MLHFPFQIVCYIYFTRIIVYLLKVSCACWRWVVQAFRLELVPKPRVCLTHGDDIVVVSMGPETINFGVRPKLGFYHTVEYGCL